MRRDKDTLKPPETDAPELILADAESRRQRTLVLNRAPLAKRRPRLVKVDSYAREKLEDAAREIHGNVDVTPSLASNVLVGEEIEWKGRHYVVAAVCGQKKCAPNGWTRLEPMRLGIEHDHAPFPPIIRRCDHNPPLERRDVPAPLVPTVGAVHGDKDQGSPLVSYEKAESLREQYVSRMHRKASAAWAAGDLVRERTYTNLAQRADAMTDEVWLTNRKAILGN